MPSSLNCFATRADHEAVVRFLFDSTDIRMFESYSEFGQELREFRSFEELAAAFDVGMDPHGHGYAILLMLCSPAVEPDPRIERISLDPSRCHGHNFRYNIEGNLIQLYLGGISAQTITISQYGHMGEAAARDSGGGLGRTQTLIEQDSVPHSESLGGGTCIRSAGPPRGVWLRPVRVCSQRPSSVADLIPTAGAELKSSGAASLAASPDGGSIATARTNGDIPI